METLNQLNFTRTYTQGRLQSIKEGQWDIQPEGMNNTIRWNVGHIFVTMESFLQRVVSSYEPVHSEWIPLFKGGTKPKDWTLEPPTNEELLLALAEQPARAIEVLTGKLDLQLPEVMQIGKIHEMATVEAVIQFAIWHEGIHAGIIFALNKMTASE
jgi:hypothetical protein